MFEVFKLLITSCFLLLSFQGFSQKSLTLDRSGHIKRIHFEVEDEIKIWLDDTQLKGRITYIGNDTIFIDDKEVAVSDIKAIKYKIPGYGAALLRQVAVKFPIAGGALLLIDIINGASDPKYSQFSPGIVITAGALIISGPVAYFIAYRKYKIGDRNQLKIIDTAIK